MIQRSHQEELDDDLLNKALFFGGVCAVVVIVVFAFAYWLITNV